MPFAGLGAAGDRVVGVDADHVLDLGTRPIGVGLRQVHLVEDRNDLDAEVERGVAVGDGLRLDALARIDDEERAFARRQRPADFVREVDVAGRVDQVQLVGATVASDVFERRGLRLDGDAALALDFHRVEHLRFHLPVGEAAAALDQAIGEGRFAMVDVGDDRKIADLIHAHSERGTKTLNNGGSDRNDRTSLGDHDFRGGKRRRGRPKKRHVESMTRLPTKRMATACWDFIVVKTPRAQAAPRLDFSTLQRANTNSIHRLSTNGCGRPGGNFGRLEIPPRSPPNPLIEATESGSASGFGP